jgi:D-arabinose 1-dehydrogenase-like Zn-dependent alcohol dehydrogenase
MFNNERTLHVGRHRHRSQWRLDVAVGGSLTGTPAENEDNLAFSSAHGVAAMIETMPFEDAPKAYERMMSGAARFRVVLDIAGE